MRLLIVFLAMVFILSTPSPSNSDTTIYISLGGVICGVTVFFVFITGNYQEDKSSDGNTHEKIYSMNNDIKNNSGMLAILRW